MDSGEDCHARYHRTSHSNAVSSLSSGSHPRSRRTRLISSLKYPASCGPLSSSSIHDAPSPQYCRHPFGNPRDRTRIFLIGPEVISRCESRSTRRFAKKLLGKPNISVNGLKNMLPRTNRMRPPNPHRLARQKSSNKIRKQPVARPVASADHVARTRRRHGNSVHRQRLNRKVRLPKGRRHNLRAGL